MRLALLFTIPALAAAPALAADPQPAAPSAPEPPVCTTVTTVVKRGDVVLSSNSTTRCEDAAHPGASLGLHPGEVLAAPEAVLDSLAAGDGDLLKLRNTAGDWQVIDSRTGDVCHLILSVRTAPRGYRARSEGCRGELGQAGAWTFRNGAAEILRPDGRLIVRLAGTRDRVTGATVGGDALTARR